MVLVFFDGGLVFPFIDRRWSVTILFSLDLTDGTIFVFCTVDTTALCVKESSRAVP